MKYGLNVINFGEPFIPNTVPEIAIEALSNSLPFFGAGWAGGLRRLMAGEVV
ncbi:MAG: hypothetical protein PVJ38_05540 [Candidatus Bathyarchaeota archaeon]|jgi:hypothetical protein